MLHNELRRGISVSLNAMSIDSLANHMCHHRLNPLSICHLIRILAHVQQWHRIENKNKSHYLSARRRYEFQGREQKRYTFSLHALQVYNNNNNQNDGDTRQGDEMRICLTKATEKVGCC